MAYPPEFLDALGSLGLAPRPDTPAAFVRDAVNDLYRFELRRLRDHYRAGQVPKPAFLEAVVRLRKRYWVLSLSAANWQRICGATTTS